MGCTTSKLDDLPAVALCRDRCTYLEAAIHQRYAFADAHVAYTQSLKGISQSLYHFINLHHRFVASTGVEEDSPEIKKKIDLEIDNKRRNDSPKKVKLATSTAAAAAHSDSNSRSGHIEFDSESDDDIDSLHHSDHSSPLHHHLHGGDNDSPIGYMDSDYIMAPPASYSGRFMHMNYMKNSSMPPSVIYEQKPSSPHRVYFGDSTSYANPNDPNLKNTAYPYFPNYGPGPGPGPVSGLYGYGSSTTDVSFSKPPPGPPSPPKSTPWDFLNPFETFYPPYTPSRDSRELREEEGIPDLEDEDFRQEIVKEVQGKEKFVAPMEEREEPLGSSGASTSGASLYQTRPSVSVEKEGLEFEVHVVEKKVVEDGGDVAGRGGGGGGGWRAVSEVAKEIETQFLRAAESGSEVAKLLEVGKHPYGRKHVSSKTLHGLASSPSKVSRSSTSSSTAAPTYADIEEELASKSRNLSSTLHKIHLWEKKLYDEVKAEEKLRVTHEKNLRRLKRLDERGAESNKVDSTRKLVRSLSTKIRIAIQVVDKISITINKIRDEELWLQLNELIQGLKRMWKAMFICHQSQCEAIKEVKGLGPIKASKKLEDDHVEATRTLGYELIDWILRFSSWVMAQKGYVRELNSWLKKCLHYEPEETIDGIAPFSPGRMGAPAIFVICNQWEQALDRISEKEVVEAMRSFTTSVLQVWEHDRLDSRGHGELETRGRNMDREEQRIQKEIQELERKMANSNLTPRNGNVVYQSDTTSNDSLQGSLRRIFEALESFMLESKTAYEDLSQRVEEECGGRETEE